MKHIRLSSFSEPFAKSKLHEEFISVLNEFIELGIKINPNVWFSSEWFCPDHVEGIGVPFYLQSKILMNYLERNGVRVEGKTKSERADLFRHEISHVVDNCFGLRRLKKRQKIFGLSSTTYPEFFIPKINVDKKAQIFHLDDNYWQAHPCEDFAETFSFVVKNWKQRKSFSFNSKVSYCVGLIEKGDVFLKRKKQCLSFESIDNIVHDKRSLGDFIIHNLSDRANLLNTYNFPDKNSRSIEVKSMEYFKSKSKEPWAVDNLRQLLSFRENYLGQETFVSKNVMKELESGDTGWLRRVGLNRIYM